VAFPVNVGFIVLEKQRKYLDLLRQVYGMAKCRASVTAELNCRTVELGEVWL
jgi:flagellar biosynthesis/type III secretory pathway M-ring protein FliF/YscJ